MKYIQNGIKFNFKFYESRNEWTSVVRYKSLQIEIIIPNKMFDFEFYFQKRNFNLDDVKNLTEHIIYNITFINTKSKMWTKMLYNGVGKNVEQSNLFQEEQGYFENIIAIELTAISPGHYGFDYSVLNFYSSKKGATMDPYFSYLSTFTYIGKDYACFNGIIKE